MTDGSEVVGFGNKIVRTHVRSYEQDNSEQNTESVLHGSLAEVSGSFDKSALMVCCAGRLQTA
jgi:hypothetical protein